MPPRRVPDNRRMDRPLLIPRNRTRKVTRGQLFGFTFRDPEATVVGRVVRDDARPGSFRSARYLIYVYGPSIGVVPDDVEGLSRSLTPESLLFPPEFTNLAGWSGGWFWPIAQQPITDDLELPQHCFEDSRGAYYDEYTRPLRDKTEPVGRISFTGYNGIALRAFGALGLTTRDGKTASHLFAEQLYRR